MEVPTRGSSHAKIILIGEHSVVYGEPAIALPLPAVIATATLAPAKAGQVIDSRYYQGLIADAPANMAGIKKLLVMLADHFGQADQPWHLTIKSDLPAERGMGSSAATAVAIIRAFFKFYQVPLDRPTLLKWAAIEEAVTHRSPSGLDAATVSATTPLWFIKGAPGQPLPMDLTATLVIADTGVTGATKEAITTVKDHLAEEPLDTKARLNQMGRLTVAAKSALATGNLDQLGVAMNSFQDELAALGVSDAALDRLITCARSHGARGAKLTGGGRGGCMIALVPTAMEARHLAGVLRHNGAQQTWIQPLKGGQ